MVIKKMGRVATIITMTATSLGTNFRTVRYTGKPTKPARVKPINCLLVRLKATFVFTLLKSLGIGTYAIFTSFSIYAYHYLKLPYVHKH